MLSIAVKFQFLYGMYDIKKSEDSRNYFKTEPQSPPHKLFGNGAQHKEWTIPFLSAKANKRTNEHLKELKEISSQNHIVRIQWFNEKEVFVFFNCGISVLMAFDEVGNLSKIQFDRSLKEKITSQHISDFIYTPTFSVCGYKNSQISLFRYEENMNSRFKLASSEITSVAVNIPGPSGRILNRKLCINSNKDMILVWWKNSNNDVSPWSPPRVKDVEIANIHVYKISGESMDLICYHKTKYQVLHAQFSCTDGHRFYFVEQSYARTGKWDIGITVFEIALYGRLQKLSENHIYLRSCVKVLKFNPTEDKLLLCCADNSVIVHTLGQINPRSVLATFVAKAAAWHPDGQIFTIAGESGQMQCFDFALNRVFWQLCNQRDIPPLLVVDAASFVGNDSATIANMEWAESSDEYDDTSKTRKDSYILISFSCGSLLFMTMVGLSRLNTSALIRLNLKRHCLNEATNLLLTSCWDKYPITCLSMLSELANYVMKSSSSEQQNIDRLMVALGSFYAPSTSINKQVIKQLSQKIRNIARRFFHFLLRQRNFETAFRIATNLNDRDLFMRLFHGAKNSHNTRIAAAALNKATTYQVASSHSEDFDENDDCSCSECSTSQSEEEKHSIEVEERLSYVSASLVHHANRKTLKKSLRRTETENEKFDTSSLDRVIPYEGDSKGKTHSKDIIAISKDKNVKTALDSKTIKIVHFGVV